MWILIFLFLLSVVVLGWVLFGYYIWLFLLGILKRKPKPSVEEPQDLPLVTLIVPAFDEEAFILQKIENLKSLDYPNDKLQVIFVDGGSQDKTRDIIQNNKTSYMSLIESAAGGKVNQLNCALQYAEGKIVFITDADGLMSPHCIKETLKEFYSDRKIWLVGICSYSKGKYELDRYHWLTQNKGRLMESAAFTSSIVIAICYAFRADLLSKFPEDVVADDVYISYFTNNLGYKVSYIDRCYAEELRGPANIRDFLGHKFRKANAFLKESLRFLYKASEMSPAWRVIFLTKISQMVLVPWFFSAYVVLGASLISLGRLDVFLLGSVFLLFLLLLTSKFFSLIKTPQEEQFGLWIMAKTFILSNFILFLSGISFIFFRQSSSYKKVDTSDT